MPVADHGQYDQNVPHDGNQNKDREEDSDGDELSMKCEVCAGRVADVREKLVQEREINVVARVDPTIALVHRIRTGHFKTPCRELLDELLCDQRRVAIHNMPQTCCLACVHETDKYAPYFVVQDVALHHTAGPNVTKAVHWEKNHSTFTPLCKAYINPNLKNK